MGLKERVFILKFSFIKTQITASCLLEMATGDFAVGVFLEQSFTEAANLLPLVILIYMVMDEDVPVGADVTDDEGKKHHLDLQVHQLAYCSQTYCGNTVRK